MRWEEYCSDCQTSAQLLPTGTRELCSPTISAINPRKMLGSRLRQWKTEITDQLKRSVNNITHARTQVIRKSYSISFIIVSQSQELSSPASIFSHTFSTTSRAGLMFPRFEYAMRPSNAFLIAGRCSGLNAAQPSKNNGMRRMLWVPASDGSWRRYSNPPSTAVVIFSFGFEGCIVR